MNDAERYPNGVTKLGPLQKDSTWMDADNLHWRWDDWSGWRYWTADGWQGSFATVEGAPPYRALAVGVLGESEKP